MLKRPKFSGLFIWIALFTVCFAFTGFFAKKLSSDLSAMDLVFYRSLVVGVLLIPLILKKKILIFPKYGKRFLWMRSLFGFVGMSCFFFAVSKLPLSVAVFLAWCSPIFVLIFSGIFLKEKLHPESWRWVLLAFVGLTFLVQPNLNWEASWALGVGIGIFGSMAGGAAYVMVRVASSHAPPTLIVFYFSWVSAILSFSFLKTSPMLVLALDKNQLIELILLGITSGIAQLSMTRAYQAAIAGLVSLLGLFTAIFSAVLGYLLLGEVLNPAQLFGIIALGLSLIKISFKKRS